MPFGARARQAATNWVDDHLVARGCARAAKLGPLHDDGSICVIERTAGWGDGAGVGETI
jgi:hypothetical protein